MSSDPSNVAVLRSQTLETSLALRYVTAYKDALEVDCFDAWTILSIICGLDHLFLS